MRVPVRLLPLAIRVVRAVRRALERLHDDLTSMAEPQTVEDLVTTVYRPGCCIDCGTTDPTGMCDSCAVLGTGRLPS